MTAGESSLGDGPRAELRPPSFGTKMAYGFGSVAYGVKEN